MPKSTNSPLCVKTGTRTELGVGGGWGIFFRRENLSWWIIQRLYKYFSSEFFCSSIGRIADTSSTQAGFIILQFIWKWNDFSSNNSPKIYFYWFALSWCKLFMVSLLCFYLFDSFMNSLFVLFMAYGPARTIVRLVEIDWFKKTKTQHVKKWINNSALLLQDVCHW